MTDAAYLTSVFFTLAFLGAGLFALLAGGCAYIQKEAHNASEKYKEGKFILELAKTDQKL